MSNSSLDIGRPSVNVPTPEQAGAAARAANAKRAGRTASGGASTDNLTVQRESASPQYGANAAVGGPKLSAPGYMDATDLMATLFGLRKKQAEAGIDNAEQRIHDRAADKETQHKEMITKLKTAASAEKKSHKTGTLLKVLSWIGVGLSFVVAGVVGVVSGGAAMAPLLMIAVASTALLIAQQSGGMEKAMDAMGMDDKAKMGLTLGITAVMLVLNVAAVIASGGASAVGVAADVAEASTEVAATTGEAAVSAGAAAAETGVEASTSATEVAVEAATEVTEVAVEAATEATTEATEVAVEAATEATTEATEVAVEAATEATTEATEVAVEAATEATTEATEVAEVAVETGTEVTESAAKTTTDAATKSARVMQIASKVKSGISVGQGVTQITTGGITIDSSVESYKGTKARAGAMRDKAVMAKMQAQNENDLRQMQNMIERLESAQAAVMSTISKSAEVSLEIRQNI